MEFSLNKNLYNYIVYIFQFYSGYKNVITRAHLPRAELLLRGLEEDGTELGADFVLFSRL